MGNHSIHKISTEVKESAGKTRKLNRICVPGHQLREVEGSLSAKKRMKLALLFGSSDRNFSNTVSKLETVASSSFSGIVVSSQISKNHCSKDESERTECEFVGKFGRNVC